MTDSIPIRKIGPGVSGLGDDAFTFNNRIKRRRERRGKAKPPKPGEDGRGKPSRFSLEQRKAIVKEYLELRKTDYRGTMRKICKKYGLRKNCLHGWRYKLQMGVWK